MKDAFFVLGAGIPDDGKWTDGLIRVAVVAQYGCEIRVVREVGLDLAINVSEW